MPALRNLLGIALFGSLLSGCAREAGEAQAPAPGWAAGWVLPAESYEFPPKTLPRKHAAAPAPATRGVSPTRKLEPATPIALSPLRFAATEGVPTYADGRPRPLAPELIAAEFPSGDACVGQLRSSGVQFQVVADKRGVQTPIAIEGPIGGVRYWTVGAGPMVSDCRLALALAKIAPEHPTWKIERVRIYRIIHRIPPSDLFLIGVEATDPEFYLPFYMGEFDAGGKLVNENDPLLYWMLPVLRDPPRNAFSQVRDWMRRHAGDPYWIRVVHPSGFTEWVDEEGNPDPG